MAERWCIGGPWDGKQIQAKDTPRLFVPVAEDVPLRVYSEPTTPQPSFKTTTYLPGKWMLLTDDLFHAWLHDDEDGPNAVWDALGLAYSLTREDARFMSITLPEYPPRARRRLSGRLLHYFVTVWLPCLFGKKETCSV